MLLAVYSFTHCIPNNHGSTQFQDFPNAFKTWELQKGYLMIHVKYADNNFYITQQRYLTEANVTDNSNLYISLNYTTAGTPNFEDTTISYYFKDTEEMKWFQ